MQDTFLLRCDVCKEENYVSSKNKKNVPEKIKLKKYCSKCHAHNIHTEKKA